MAKTVSLAFSLIFALALAGCTDALTSASKKTSPSPTNPSNSPSPSTSASPSTSPSPGSYSVTFSFTGPTVSPTAVYVAWIEDESGNNLQNVYVCNSEVGIGKTLTGDALPIWKTVKYTSNYDGLTGASTQSNFSIQRSLAIGSVRKFRLCFEIDRSLNANSYFTDRPSFLYQTELIDLDSLKPSYTLSLVGWMSNNTTGTYGQQPKTSMTIPGFAQYKLMTDLIYIQDGSGSVQDMVTSAQAVVTEN
jgi:hypothetical protein